MLHGFLSIGPEAWSLKPELGTRKEGRAGVGGEGRDRHFIPVNRSYRVGTIVGRGSRQRNVTQCKGLGVRKFRKFWLERRGTRDQSEILSTAEFPELFPKGPTFPGAQMLGLPGNETRSGISCLPGQAECSGLIFAFGPLHSL